MHLKIDTETRNRSPQTQREQQFNVFQSLYVLVPKSFYKSNFTPVITHKMHILEHQYSILH